MMARRATLFRLCQRITATNQPIINRKLPGYVSSVVLTPSTCTNHFGTSVQRLKSTRIVSDEFDDKHFAGFEKFEEDYETIEDEFHLDRDKRTFRNNTERKPRKWSSDLSHFQRRDNRRFDDFNEQSQEGDNEFYRPRFQRNSRFKRDYDDSFESRQQNDRRSMSDLWESLNEKTTDFGGIESVEKNVYKEHPDVLNRPEEEVRKFMETHEMSVKGNSKKNPILNFNETNFSDEISHTLRSMKFDQPTPIQSIGWPHALSGSNIVGIAQTGSGKTLSFILPAIVHIQQRRQNGQGRGPMALVMCPTRELAMQCHQVLQRFSRPCRITSAVVYGGQSKLVQADKLSNPNLDIIIATPGRLLDFLSTDTVSLRDCSFLVLDEADRMLDMGFEPQIRSIMKQIRPDRQVLMWSATWPRDIQDLASDFLEQYVHVKIGRQDLAVNANISHEFHYTDSYEKINILAEHLRSNPHPTNPRKTAKTLIFCETKRMCSRLHSMLRNEGFFVDSVHGDKTQQQRDMAMHKFRTNTCSILIASEVAARGLDVTDIEFVINYDIPKHIDSYIHRVGRTARAGKKGTAINLFTVEDLDMVPQIMKVLEDVDHEIPEILHQLMMKRQKLKSYRKQDRRHENYGYGKPRNNYRY